MSYESGSDYESDFNDDQRFSPGGYDQLVSITKSKKPGKKYDARFKNSKTGKTKVTSFGAAGMSDYTKHKDKKRRSNYRGRHQKDLGRGDPTKAGYLSYYILWGDSTSFRESVAAYRKRFFPKSSKMSPGRKSKTPTKKTKDLHFKSGYDLYSDKNPKDTVPIKYRTIKDVRDTIQMLKKHHASGKYSHARIVQIVNVMTQRLRVQAPTTTRYKLAKSYFEQLKRHTARSEMSPLKMFNPFTNRYVNVDGATAKKVLQMLSPSKTSTKTKPELWKRIVSEVKAGSSGGNSGQWSARKAQLAVARYKKAGGGYVGKKSSNNSLSKWSKQKWRTKSGKPSLKTGERYLPEKAIKNMSDKDYKKTTAAKRKGMKQGKQFVKQPKTIAKKVKKYRK